MMKILRLSILGVAVYIVLVACSSTNSTPARITDVEREIPDVPTEPFPGESEPKAGAQTAAPREDEPMNEITATQESQDYRIVTLLPRDAIPAIDNPAFLSIEEADQEYALDELVIGVEFNGDARAYSIPLLSRHEIVNDTVGGVKIAVTW